MACCFLFPVKGNFSTLRRFPCLSFLRAFLLNAIKRNQGSSKPSPSSLCHHVVSTMAYSFGRRLFLEPPATGLARSPVVKFLDRTTKTSPRNRTFFLLPATGRRKATLQLEAIAGEGGAYEAPLAVLREAPPSSSTSRWGGIGLQQTRRCSFIFFSQRAHSTTQANSNAKKVAVVVCQRHSHTHTRAEFASKHHRSSLLEAPLAWCAVRSHNSDPRSDVERTEDRRDGESELW